MGTLYFYIFGSSTGNNLKVTINKSLTLFEFLMGQYPDTPRTRIKKLLQSGTVRVNDRSITLHSYKLKPGDTVDFRLHTEITSKAGLPFPVLYEDQHVIVVDKPAGILTSSIDGSISVQQVISQFLKKLTKGNIRAYVVHRLDKEVSGILLFAKSDIVMNALKDNWRQTDKHYYACVESVPANPEGTIKSWLIEDKSFKMHSVNEREGAKLAVTHYKTIRIINDYALLDVRIETGRKNQIRVHLSDIGCPIVGDRKYGAKTDYIRRIRLHAYYLSFPHPVSRKMITVKSTMPKGFLSLRAKDEHYK